MSLPPPADICQFLEWDSRFFERNVGRVIASRLSPELMPVIQDWCHTRRIECLYLLVDADQEETIQLAADAKFRLVDIRITLKRPVPEVVESCPPAGGIRVRSFRREDLPVLRDLAGKLHQNTRFGVDPHFSSAQCRQLYEVWIARSCDDPQGSVLVAEDETGLAGYIACSIKKDEGQIDLIGVAGRSQGRGIGRALLAESQAWFASQKVGSISVVTQGRNLPAQRLYQASGFVTNRIQLWFHLWLTPPALETKL